MKKKNVHWQNLKKNYVTVVPVTMSLCLGLFIVLFFFNTMIDLVHSLSDPNSKMITLLVLIWVMMKICNWVGNDLMDTWGKVMTDAMKDK